MNPPHSEEKQFSLQKTYPVINPQISCEKPNYQCVLYKVVSTSTTVYHVYGS